ncbi:hypothetical protein RHGRI_009870 [Rhododendron griersonianum]|uniref:F-box domain-containing protein n=1 Tax=Rhododendron griersonianum TaxID=479676 RepID=A0AAV6KGE7_9ERIC|nr:hypothetical protein RHGRI_009870 [Rhododendron griersonianum]
MNQSTPTKKKRKLSVPELPAHITVDILSRLPVKTLLHSQLVCKHWLSLTSPNPPFARLHLSKSPIALLIRPACPDRCQLRLIDLRLQALPNFHPKHAQLKLSPNLHLPLLGHRVVNSCNGLLCLYDQSDPVFVCNPVLGEYISIPLSQHMGRYDHTTSAFGFSPKTKKYKVLQLFLKFVSYESETYEAEAEIYTLGEGPWRSLGRVPFHPDSQSFYASLSGALDWFNHSFYASLNGAFHWLTFDRASPDFIRCFDFDSERFRVVCEPPEFGTHKKEFPNHMSLGVLGGSLSICDFSSPICVEIWIMKDYGIKESWTKEFVIENEICKRGQLDKHVVGLVVNVTECRIAGNQNSMLRDVIWRSNLGGFVRETPHNVSPWSSTNPILFSLMGKVEVSNQEKQFWLMEDKIGEAYREGCETMKMMMVDLQVMRLRH